MDVADEVKLVISKSLQIPIERLTEETKLEDLGAESLKIIEMVFELEERFDISIVIRPDSAGIATDKAKGQPENSAFQTIGDVCRAVNDLVDAKASR
jgi:acyl carrier protein